VSRLSRNFFEYSRLLQLQRKSNEPTHLPGNTNAARGGQKLMIQSNHSGSIQANSKTPYDMPHESYAQSLRVIGQALETLRINAFALEKDGDKYIVRDWEPSFLKNIAAEIWGLGDSGQTPFTNKKSGDLLVYNSADVERLEATGRARRGSKKLQDTYKISSGLRIVGDYFG
jgi:hypothetical protein